MDLFGPMTELTYVELRTISCDVVRPVGVGLDGLATVGKEIFQPAEHFIRCSKTPQQNVEHDGLKSIKSGRHVE